MDGDEHATLDLQLAPDYRVTRVLLAVWFLGCVLLSVARIPAFSSDRALWLAALPSERPRVAINVASALIHDGNYEGGALWSVRGLELAKRPASAYEREAVTLLVQRQLNYVNLFVPICDRPLYQSHC